MLAPRVTLEPTDSLHCLGKMFDVGGGIIANTHFSLAKLILARMRISVTPYTQRCLQSFVGSLQWAMQPRTGLGPMRPGAKSDAQKRVVKGQRPLPTRPGTKSDAQKCVRRGQRPLPARPGAKSDAQKCVQIQGAQIFLPRTLPRPPPPCSCHRFHGPGPDRNNPMHTHVGTCRPHNRPSL